METNNTILADIFQETDKFLKGFDPKKHSPPVIMSVFLPIREKAYSRLTQEKNKNSNKEDKESLIKFVEKFEIEYIEILQEKLKNRYIDYIQTKQYNVPHDINFKDLKNQGAVSEISQLATSIAEWSLELEVVAYTLEGLKLYGLQEFNGVEKMDYVGALKRGFTFNKKASLQTLSEYLIRKLVNFSLNKFSSVALMGGLTRIEIGTQAILEIFLKFSLTNKIPWTLVLNYLNLPWVLGGLAFSLLFKLLNDYALQDELVTNLRKVFATFENNKLYLMGQRKKISEIMRTIIKGNSHEERQSELRKLTNIVKNLLNPSEQEFEMEEVSQEEVERMYNIQELDDYVLVTDKDHKEKEDTSGVIIVDW